MTSDPHRQAGTRSVGRNGFGETIIAARWFSRTHPIELPSGRILLPLYSDGFSFSLMGISDDGGQTWFASEPIVGYGNIQPSVVRKEDGTLVA